MSSKVMVISFCLVAAVACQKKEQAPPAQPATATQTATTPNAPGTVKLPPTVNIPTGGMTLWLVADDIQSGAGGTVASWTNTALTGVAATADKPEQQPTIVANVINGHAVVRFDGNNNILKTSIDISPAKMPNATIFAVWRSATDATSPLRKLYGDDNGGYDRAVGLDNRAAASGKNYTVFTGKGVTGYFALKAGETHLTTDEYTKTSFSGWVDGLPTLDNVPAQWGDALPNLYIGGTGTSYHEPWQGDLAEILVYDRVVTDKERLEIEDYLGTKYGLILAR